MERTRTTRRAGRAVVAGLLTLLAIVGVPAPTAEAGPAGRAGREPALPIVFVHGGSGSAAQYQTQALRFASNRYPNVVTAIDRISADPAVIHPILDDYFDDVMALTGDRQIYVVGHSQGVAVMNSYLDSSRERAARVAKYVGIDSASGPSPDVCPGGVDDSGDWAVPCMGIWGRGDPARRFGPDRNVQFPDQGHVEVVGSRESFVAQHEFFTGSSPRTTLVLPEPPRRVAISGRALDFPANTGLAGSRLEVWEVDGRTGARTRSRPRATVDIGEDGNWGPVRVDGRKHYELALTRDEVVHHFYFEPFVRSDHLVRLNVSPPDSGLSGIVERGESQAVVSIQRQKEWWGDHPTDSDALTVTTRSPTAGHQPPVEVVDGTTAPVAGSTIGIITFDAGSDGVSDPGSRIPLGAFLSGVDVFYPAADPPDGTISFVASQRGEPRRQVVNTLNWSSSGHSVQVGFRDWTQDITTWSECVRARPSPCRRR